MQLLLRERLFPHDSKMRFQISPQRQGNHPIRHIRINLEEQFKLGSCMSPTIDGGEFPEPAVLLEVTPLQFRQQPTGRQSPRLTQESPLSWEQGMVDPNIRERLTVLHPYLRHPHPYVEELRPMGIVGQYSLNDCRFHRKENRGRRPNAAGGFRTNIQGNRLGRTAPPRPAKYETAHDEHRTPQH